MRTECDGKGGTYSHLTELAREIHDAGTDLATWIPEGLLEEAASTARITMDWTEELLHHLEYRVAEGLAQDLERGPKD